MQAFTPDGPFCCRSVWISDVHLGSVHCKAEQLLELLNRIECQHLYLVGDMIDVWAMSKRVHWPESHSKVIRKLIEISHGATQVSYIPGNHDAIFREFCGGTFENIGVCESMIHESTQGKRMLVIHGDELDYAVRYSRLNRFLGDIAYELLMSLNRHVNAIRALVGLRYWSLSKWVKVNMSQAESAISAYQQAAVLLAKDRGLDGIICGHLHYPLVEQFDDITYCNDGDWVENCTALVEDYAGEFQLVNGFDLAPTSIAQLYPRAA